LFANPVTTDVAIGVIADFGVSVGVSNLNNSNEGYTIGLSMGKYFGAQLTFSESQDTTMSILNPFRYISGASIGLGLGVSSPINASHRCTGQ
jgi:hypothetical protein